MKIYKGDKVRLKEDYKPGSNKTDYEWGIVERIFEDYTMPEAWIRTDQGYQLIEYVEYLEPVCTGCRIGKGAMHTCNKYR